MPPEKILTKLYEESGEKMFASMYTFVRQKENICRRVPNARNKCSRKSRPNFSPFCSCAKIKGVQLAASAH